MDVVEFPPEGTYEFADTVARLVDAGYLKTQSVGFIPKKWEDGDFDEDDKKKPRRTYTKQELLEISIVPVPSNPNALMNAVKEGVITTKQFEAITSKNLIDDIINAPIVDLTEEPKPAKTSQEQIIDELDYLELMLKENGASDKVKEILQRIAQSYLAQGGIVPKESIPLAIIGDATQDATIPAVNIEYSEIKESLKRIIGG
jgi:hypothetical protein